MADPGRVEVATGSDGTPEASAHSPEQQHLGSSSPHKGTQQLQLELRLLEALQIYHPSKLQGVHRQIVLYGLMEFLEKRLHRQFSSQEILQTLGSFYNLEMLKPEDDELDFLGQQEDFSLPPFIRDELKDT